ncbi:MAG: class I SAM-dependent methyltransferase [Candidatus Electrothrix sp. AS4_5]|nr:class I SAM-dependent methyltransferase [Candidatus Electrothrix gigas]MCI5190086.1 class I SAM-dependent methyltransferase [Candidatus Electrothrix gigas]
MESRTSDELTAMDNKTLRKKYDNVYKKGSETFYTYNSFPESTAIIQMLKRWNELNVLEIGCGEGHLAAMIAFAGVRSVHAVDYSGEAIAIAKKHCRMPNVRYECRDYSTIEKCYDVVVLQGVLEHLDDPFASLQMIMRNNVQDDGILITSSPSFINPRGYIWMALKTLLDVPMSLSDLHYLCPHNFEEFSKEHNYNLEIMTADQDWGNGERLLVDFQKRLPNALRDANLPTDRVEQFMEWLAKVLPYQPENEFTGATMVYKFKRY